MAVDLAASKIEEAKRQLENVSVFEEKEVKGASKLKKRIQAEIKFLQRGLKNSRLNEKDVQCSNLGQLGALVEVALEVPKVTGLLQSYRNEDKEKIVIDIVADNGEKWIKVIMRNPKALHLIFTLGKQGSVKPLNEVAEDFQRCAELHPVLYCPPKILFWFCNGVSEGLARSIEERGVAVQGKKIPDQNLGLPDFTVNDSDLESESDECSSSEETVLNAYERNDADAIPKEDSSSEVAKLPVRFLGGNSCKEDSEFCQRSKSSGGYSGRVNLDVTAMIAYVSATANGGSNLIFKDKILNEQAACERKNPVKMILNKYFEGKELVACREAVDHFQDIVSVIGGDGEKERAKELLARLTVVPGQDYFQDKMRTGGKIRLLPRITFGTGQALKAITITSNTGFIRATQCQGIDLAVFLHPPRALTEAKECEATPICDILLCSS